ncbi:unnamed protein product [Adineta steineri]|uniref:Ubiquitin-like domain-containing protein n=1 Tax=Adineta steineri TaxID=433720 RepID=A0A816B765_9BILA|nr:unnamed protein product [Adineta steineri]CAF1370703.1 unnamed protein product [Adineta steineri]CAF1420888.1 unnamed protein product [Adineta steineri]CAF1442106.1 unnamed protein product [Adineta steineri]CAF1505230.1 unnamed protein product [Adineta steineri]
MGSKSSPSDIINLKLILVSGKTAEFQFRPSTTASDVAKHVFENWPEDWGNEQRVDRYEVLRLIYQGRFLHGNVTLGALRLQQGKTTVMHLVPRENLPEPTNGDQKRKHKHDNNQDRTADHSQRAISPHRSNTASPNSTTTGCCEGCTIL